MIPTAASLLRIYLNVNERWHGAPLYRAIVEKARALKLAGASVFPVELSYGAHRQLHDAESDYTSYDIPVVIEIVDAPEKVEALRGELDAMVGEGLVVWAPVHVARYTHHAAEGGDDGKEGPPSSAARTSSGENVAIRAGEATTMKIEGEAKCATVYVGSSDTWGGQNLAIAIVERCRKMGMAGATVSRGIMGFGKHSVIHRAHLLGLSDDLPEKIEIVDRPEEIDRLLPVLDEMIGGGLIIVEDVHVVRYLHDPKGSGSKRA
jgi:PII-like signaling protein